MPFQNYGEAFFIGVIVMVKEKILFTSESVSEGHPDKVCDQISDAILDACLKEDKNSHVACETFATGNYILIGGEITCKKHPNYAEIAKKVLKEIGYDRPELGTDYHTVKIDIKVKEQSPDINRGVNQIEPEKVGAGDQGIMFGYATNETEGYMPLPISIAHKLMREATRLRKEGLFKGARPDMKSQVTIDYTDKDHIRIDTILMSVQHDEDVDLDAFKKYIHDEIMVRVAKSFGLNDDFRYFVNPTGRFVVGGPEGDTGLTGRKIIVVLSLEKIQPKLIEVQPIWRDILQKTLLQRVLLIDYKFNYLMRLVFLNHYPLLLRHIEPLNILMSKFFQLLEKCLIVDQV